MPATLESLDDLKSWNDYRDFMKVRLKQVPADSPFFISKEKIDFDVDGKPWRGFAVLAGPKGLLAVKKIKKQGVLWREGTCQLNGKEFTVDGLAPNHLKYAHLTLKKLKLGYKIAGSTEDDADDEEAKPDPGLSKEAQEVTTRRQEAIAAIKDAAKLKEPANARLLKDAAGKMKNVETAVAKKEWGAADKTLDDVEDLLTQVVEGPEPADDADPDLAGLGDWQAYRDFTKVQLKRMPKEGGNFYITRKKVEFDVDGKPYKAFAVLLGKESKLKPTVQALKKEGTLMHIGTVVPEGKTLKVSGIKPELIKWAAKLFIKLRLGRKIVAGEAPAEGAGAEGAAAGAAAGAASGANGEAEFRKLLLTETATWQKLATSVDNQVEGLRTTLKSSGDAQLTKIADQGLNGLTDVPRRPLMDAIKELESASGAGLKPAVEKVRKAATDYSNYLQKDARIQACDQNPFGVSIKIRDTLAPALAKLEKVLASAPNVG